MSLEPTDHPSRGNVLVVDDDRQMRDVLREILHEEGYTVQEARDGQAALELLRQTSESWVVLTDQVMPRLSGPGLFAAVLADPHLRTRHAFIYMTAADHAISPDVQPVLEAVHTLILPKPFTVDACIDAVASVANRILDARA